MNNTQQLVAAAIRAVSVSKSNAWLTELGAVNSVIRKSWSSKPAEEVPAGKKAAKITWWSGLIATLVVGLTGVTPMLPPRRSNEVDLELLMQVTPTAALIAAVGMVIFSLLPVPASIKENAYGSATAAILAILAPLALVLNAFRAEAIVSVSTSTTATTWFASVGAIFVTSTIIAFRSKRKAGAKLPTASWKDGMKEGKKRAAVLRKSFPEAHKAEANSLWIEELCVQSLSLTAEEQSRLTSTTPWDFLVEAYSNPEADLPHPLRTANR